MFTQAGSWGQKDNLLLAIKFISIMIILIGLIMCALEANNLGLGFWQYVSTTFLAGLEKRIWGRNFFGRSMTGYTLASILLNLLT